MRKVWFDEAWEDYIYWQTQDKKTLKRKEQKFEPAALCGTLGTDSRDRRERVAALEHRVFGIVQLAGIGQRRVRQKIGTVLRCRRAADDIDAGDIRVRRAIAAGQLAGEAAHSRDRVMIAVLGGNGSLRKIFGVYGTSAGIAVTYPADWQLAGFTAYRSRHKTVWLCEVSVFQTFVNAAHHGFPDFLRIGGLAAGLGRIVVVTAPHHAGIVRRVAGKETVAVCGCGTRLSGLRHAASEISRGTGSLGHDVLHCVG